MKVGEKIGKLVKNLMKPHPWSKRVIFPICVWKFI